jgi:hypothetical protein
MPEMNTPVDEAIRRIARHATHPGLLTIDASILARIAKNREVRSGAWRLDAISFVGALAIGALSAVALAAPTTASTVTSLGGLSHLAPSALLERGR